jgi:hypothetical protein
MIPIVLLGGYLPYDVPTMNTTMNQTFSQLITLTPYLLVYVGGMIVCAILWRKAPTAAMLAMGGLGLMLFGTLATRFLSMYLVQTRLRSSSMTSAQIGNVMTVLSLAGGLVHGGGLAAIIAAVFIGRESAPTASGFEVPLASHAPPHPHSRS